MSCVSRIMEQRIIDTEAALREEMGVFAEQDDPGADEARKELEDYLGADRLRAQEERIARLRWLSGSTE